MAATILITVSSIAILVLSCWIARKLMIDGL
jgi:hypothetical protein